MIVLIRISLRTSPADRLSPLRVFCRSFAATIPLRFWSGRQMLGTQVRAAGLSGNEAKAARNDALQYNNSRFLIHFFKLIFSGSINKISKKYKKIAQVKTCAYICKK